MTWNLDNSRSIYLQLMEEIKRRIITGVYPPGSRMASVRELADEAGVNPNTMQKALSEMEREDLVYSQRTSGRFVTDDAERIRAMRQEQAMEAAIVFIRQMEALGFNRQEVLELLSSVKGNASEDNKSGKQNAPAKGDAANTPTSGCAAGKAGDLNA